MKNKIDVSIIIPAYNAAATVGCLVNKILSEPHVAIELIVVDDGSTYGTGNIIRQTHDDRLLLIEQDNQGVYAARNAALAIHRGEWVFFLDADDDIADGFIEKRWQAATASQADVMIFNGWHSGDEHHRRAVHRKQPYGTPLQVMNGLDTVLHTANGRIICGCRWSGHPISDCTHYASSPAEAIKIFSGRFILRRAMVDSVHWMLRTISILTIRPLSRIGRITMMFVQ